MPSLQRLDASKQIIRQTITYNEATRNFQSQDLMVQQHSEWHHITISMVYLMVHAALDTPIYAKLLCNNFQWCFLPQICIAACSCASQSPQVHSIRVKLAPGWALIRVNFDPIQEIGPKLRVLAIFWRWALFHETTVYNYGGVHMQTKPVVLM